MLFQTIAHKSVDRLQFDQSIITVTIVVLILGAKIDVLIEFPDLDLFVNWTNLVAISAF